MQPLLTLLVCLSSIGSPGGDDQARPGERVYLSEVLSPTTKSKAFYYLESAGMEGALYVGKTFTKDGALKADGHYADPSLRIPHGHFTFYHLNGKVESTGEYEMGKKSGVWQRWDTWGRELAEKVYEPGSLRDIVYTQVATMPQYPGGQKVLVAYIKQHATATDGIVLHGTATASFIVEMDGKLSDVKVSGAPGETVGAGITEALERCAPWQPGTDESGLPVRVSMKVPVPF